jgi:hypothetical protein
MKSVFAALASLFAFGPFANGMSYTFDATVDLNLHTSTGPAWRYDCDGAPKFSLQAGDTLSGTFLFSPGQSLLVSDPTGATFDAFGVLFGGDPDVHTTIGYTSTLELMVSAGVIEGGNIRTQTYDDADGSSFGMSLIDVTRANTTLIGFKYSVTLDSGELPEIWMKDFHLSVHRGGSITVLQDAAGSSVSIPDAGSTFAMLASVLGGIALLKRRFV